MIVDIDRERILNFDNHPFKITDDEAIINMVDSNIQRENIFPKIIQTNKLKKEFLDY